MVTLLKVKQEKGGSKKCKGVAIKICLFGVSRINFLLFGIDSTTK
jgi:hypothetical protein